MVTADGHGDSEAGPGPKGREGKEGDWAMGASAANAYGYLPNPNKHI